LEEVTAFARSVSLTPNEAEAVGLRVNRDGVRRSAFDLLAYPDVVAADLARIWPEAAAYPADVLEQVEIDAKYAVYMERQRADIAAFRRDEDVALPADFDFVSVIGLSNESREKLSSIRPRTIGQAGRIDGMTPAAITLLLATLRKRGGERARA